MLTDEEKSEISETFSRYEKKSAGCIEALRIVQRTRRWIDDQSLKDIADFLEMTKDEVDGVATFYNLVFRKPVGKHVIFICDSVSCWTLGCEKLHRHLKKQYGAGYGETTPDGELTILPVACLGACDKAPAAMADEALFTDLNEGALDEIIQRFKSRDPEGVKFS